MKENARWNQINKLDDELLQGGVILSEWCSFIVREADTAYANGAYLASILTSVAGIETYLKSEYSKTKNDTLFKLINDSSIKTSLKSELHSLRKYRNKWVHVEEPWEDQLLLDSPEIIENELEKWAFTAIRLLRETIYENQWI